MNLEEEHKKAVKDLDEATTRFKKVMKDKLYMEEEIYESYCEEMQYFLEKEEKTLNKLI